MPNIINQIIAIDEIAQKLLNDANHVKDQYIVELNQEKEQITSHLSEKTLVHIDKILATETKFAQEQKANIKQDTDVTIKRLLDIYNQNHEKLEQDIFNNVISI